MLANITFYKISIDLLKAISPIFFYHYIKSSRVCQDFSQDEAGLHKLFFTPKIFYAVFVSLYGFTALVDRRLGTLQNARPKFFCSY